MKYLWLILFCPATCKCTRKTTFIHVKNDNPTSYHMDHCTPEKPDPKCPLAHLHKKSKVRR
jgi:hypothetical protein